MPRGDTKPSASDEPDRRPEPRCPAVGVCCTMPTRCPPGRWASVSCDGRATRRSVGPP